GQGLEPLDLAGSYRCLERPAQTLERRLVARWRDRPDPKRSRHLVWSPRLLRTDPAHQQQIRGGAYEPLVRPRSAERLPWDSLQGTLPDHQAHEELALGGGRAEAGQDVADLAIEDGLVEPLRLLHDRGIKNVPARDRALHLVREPREVIGRRPQHMRLWSL